MTAPPERDMVKYTPAMSKIALIIGANGRLGQALTSAFLAGGWRVLAQVRRTPVRAPDAGLQWLQAPVDNPAALAEAARAADVVVHAANPLYTRWQAEAMPLARNAMTAARRLNAVLMFPGNVYNFGARMPQSLTEATPQEPTTRKGRIRVRIEEAMREAARSGLRVVVIRAGDFFGGPGRGSWLDLVIAKSLRQGRVVYPGRMDAVHAWAYLPDLARVFVLAGERRADLSVFETLHYPGCSPTGREFLECLERSARRIGLLAQGRTLQRDGMPWSFLRLAGLVVPMFREVAEMRYLWNVPHQLAGERLTSVLGSVPATPLDDAMDAALRELFEITPR
jgi:nucleoside-diphosphate-sugar epimerase